MINIATIIHALPQLLHGAGISLAISFCAALLGFFGGLLLALVQTSKMKFAKGLITIYVTIIRGTPMLIQIVFLYILFLSLGIAISKFAVAVIAIGLNSSAYVSQIIRSGIGSISQGQIEAAKTLGVKQSDIIRHIILPQALTIVLPALGNELITLVKDSSLASIIGVTELYQEGNLLRSQTFDALTAYTAVALLYLLMTGILSIFVHRLENYLDSHARN